MQEKNIVLCVVLKKSENVIPTLNIMNFKLETTLFLRTKEILFLFAKRTENSILSVSYHMVW